MLSSEQRKLVTVVDAVAVGNLFIFAPDQRLIAFSQLLFAFLKDCSHYFVSFMVECRVSRPIISKQALLLW
ncbi:hypothetical protein D3C87_2023850 [compost metagenome]